MVLLVILVTLLLLEGVLAVFDPLGMVYYRDGERLATLLRTAPSGYVLPPGEYAFTRFSVTILDDTTRRVPDTVAAADADETLVFIGDSVTFGWGVNDEDTFANLIARALPQTHIINAGESGYHSTYLMRRMSEFPDADRVVILTVNNDPETRREGWDHTLFREPGSWMSSYLLWAVAMKENADAGHLFTDEEYARFEMELSAMSADPRVVVFALASPYADDPYPSIARDCCNAHPIALWSSADKLSYADGHPNAQGHQGIADQMLPVVVNQ